jgi:uncharacterized iron-regulated protein
LSFGFSPGIAAPVSQPTHSLDLFHLSRLEPTFRQSTLTRPQQLPEKLSPEQLRPVFTRSLTESKVIYLGETHDSAIDHQLQLEVLQSLQAHNPRMLLALEMFQRPYQSLLDRYLTREISEAELVDRSEYNKRWGFPWDLYAPIVRFSLAHNIRLIALNTPTEVTRKVGRKGLDSLTFADRRFIPPLSEIQLGPAVYGDRLRQIYTEIHQGKGNSDGFTRFFQAQVLWDETMADRIASLVMQYPDHQVVVLVGQGHLLYGDGIPDRVMRRLRDRHPGFSQNSQTTVLLNPDPSLPTVDPVTQRPIADWLWHFKP